MPLVRVEVRNEYGLGDPDLYRAADKDDSRALLEGVAVAGLVGVLRQLGDLAEFAAEIFHDLHDQVMATAARGQDMIVRLKHLEAGVSSVEKAALAQTNHIHFAYTAGSEWHASIRTEQNHLTRGDMPGFIMDSYEESRGPPRLFLLDKFDTAGAGACLKRYSDPSFFKMEWATSELMKAEKIKREKKTIKSKRKSRRQRSEEALDSGLSRNYNRMFDSLDLDGQNHNGEDISTYNVKSQFKKGGRSQSFTSRTKTSYMKHLIDVNIPSGHKKLEANAPSLSDTQSIHVGSFDISGDLPVSDVESKSLHKSPRRVSNPEQPPVTWDEKVEDKRPATDSGVSGLKDENQAMADRKAGISKFHLEEGLFSTGNIDQYELLADDEKKPESCSGESQDTDVASGPDNYVDALNTIESEIETDSEGRMKQELEFQKSFCESKMKSGTDKQELPPCISIHSDVKELPSCISDHSDVEELPPCIPGHSDVEELPPCISGYSDVEELPPCISGHSDVEELPPCISGYSDVEELPPCISGHLDIETPTVPPSLFYKELPEGSSLFDLPDKHVPRSPVIDVFENEGDSAHAVEMTKETIPDSTADELAAASVLLDKQTASASTTTITDSCISTESTLVSLPQATSINFWTNGGLLGLEPSKPPDFSATTKASDVGYESHQCESRTVARSDLSSVDSIQPFNKISHNMEQPQKPETGRELNMSSQIPQSGRKSSRLTEHTNHADIPEPHHDELVQETTYLVNSNSDKFENHHLQQYDGLFEKNSRGFAASGSSVRFEDDDNLKGMKLGKENILFSRNDLPVLSSTEVQSTVSISSVACQINGFHREPLAGQLELSDKSRGNNGSKLLDRSSPVAAMPHMPKKPKAEKITQPSYVKISPNSVFMEQPGYELGAPRKSTSPNSHCSDCSSPPLEHMKISFQPMNDLEGSMLKLENEPIIPLRKIDQEGTISEFRFLSLSRRSYQDMPFIEESIMSKQVDSEFDSDDDTFCKPSLNFSEDMFSQDSESNSEQWEHSGINGRKDDLYDGLRRISSSTSISSLVGLEEASNHTVGPDCQHGSQDVKCNGLRSRKSSAAGSLDLFTSGHQDSPSQLQEKDARKKELTSMLPNAVVMPLSHSQQLKSKHTKSPPSSVKDQEACELIFVSQLNEVQVSEAVDPHQSNLDVPVELVASHDKGKLKQPTPLNRSTSVQQPDERDLFLEQIRAKSFNLRRTVTTRPNLSSSRPTTNINVAAILEKANAIRQACVGSDDGDDDGENWGDD